MFTASENLKIKSYNPHDLGIDVNLKKKKCRNYEYFYLHLVNHFQMFKYTQNRNARNLICNSSQRSVSLKAFPVRTVNSRNFVSTFTFVLLCDFVNDKHARNQKFNVLRMLNNFTLMFNLSSMYTIPIRKSKNKNLLKFLQFL